MEQSSGFQELHHTADWEIEAWAPDLPRLFEQSAVGMYALSGTYLYPEPRITRTIEITAQDAESLLVKFLSELLFMGEQYGLAFDMFELNIHDPVSPSETGVRTVSPSETGVRPVSPSETGVPSHLRAKLHGAPMTEQGKEIKAVTYHNLAIQPGPRGLEVRIVFDV
jgi:SHS2 domain-containing protein